jgi:glycosyltransferase EpsE
MISDRPVISVLMSVHNNMDTLLDAIDSVLSQTYQNFEFLICDDGSSDETKSCLLDYAENNDCVRIFLNDDSKGLAHNLNMMLGEARGDYIARMDGDDICYPNRFQEQRSFMSANPEVHILGTAAHIINDNGEKSGRYNWPEKDFDIKKIIWCNPIIHPSVMMRRQALVDIGGYPNYRRRQDYALWFHAMASGLKFHNLQKALIQYRIVKRHYKKTNMIEAWRQLKIGWKGYARVGGLNPKAYAIMAWPLARSLMPSKIQQRLQKKLRRYDPRRQQSIKK